MVRITDVPIDAPVARPLVLAQRRELSLRYGGDGEVDPCLDPLDPAQFTRPWGAFLVGWEGDDAVGCGGIRRHDDRTAEVKRLYVVPERRGRGISRVLMEHIEGRAVDLGYAAVRLETGLVQPEAIGLYGSMGYGRIPPYGVWADDPLSVCFEKLLVTADRPVGP